jgi:hypothetical protein
MEDITGRLAGCKVFSKLDLKKGYHQIPVAATDIPKTAIITPFGLFEYLRMPFGLKNAGMTFQRFMDQILGGLPFCIVYLDDILVPAQTGGHMLSIFELSSLYLRSRAWFSTGRSVNFFAPRSTTWASA